MEEGGKRLYVFDFDGTLTSKNITATGVAKGMLDMKLLQVGFKESGPLLRNCVDKIIEAGHLVAIASYGDSRTVSSNKVGGKDTILYALSKFCGKEDFASSFLAIECFMPSQQWLAEWKDTHPGQMPG